ncbi:MAG: response regulator transcription factor [Bacteroidales bacterium]
MKILIIEDEKEIAESISHYLSNEKYICEKAGSFMEASEKIEIYDYDCLIVDIILPDGNGLDIIKNLKKNKPSTGIIVVSARNSLNDKIIGLDLGADDYLTKPFHLSELNSRLKSVIRRRSFEGKNELLFDKLRIVPDDNLVYVNNNALVLTKKEYDLILFLVTNKNRVVTKESIAEHLWGDDIDLVDSYDFLYNHIKNLRKKIIDAGGDDYIETIYKMGYRFGLKN